MGAYKYNTSKKKSPSENLELAKEGTIRDLHNMLNSHQIALMIRPTGFGKTYTMIQLCKNDRYNHILYLYPTDVIRQSILDDYHTEYTDGNGVVHTRQFNTTAVEQKERPDLPFIELVSYSKMLTDWRETFRTAEFNGGKEWVKFSQSEKAKIQSNWESKSETDKLKARKKWIAKKVEEIDLIILDEAHMTGAEGFMEYWPYIKHLATNRNKKKDSRLHIVGATATPLRTSKDIDIESDIFSYTWGEKTKSARIKDFTITDCWELGILQRPYYTKGILNKADEKEKLAFALKERMTGGKSLLSEKTGRKSKLSSEVIRAYNPYLDNQRELLAEHVAKMSTEIDKIKEPSQLIYDAVYAVKHQKVDAGEYLRFIVFYQDTKDLINYHEQINKAFIDGFNIDENSTGDTNKDSHYSKLNATYIVTNESKMEVHGIPVNKIEDISKRDESIRKNPNLGYNQIDLIHCIDILNMGYHVGNVAGVVVKRSTGSEIKYYQQIGRCMSVRDHETPVIIDFANADAELFRKTRDTLRDEAVSRIQEFVDKAHLSKEAEDLNKVYMRVRMAVTTETLPAELLDYYYFNRQSPIYFIQGIADALDCPESLKDIIQKIRAIGIEKYGIADLTSEIDYVITEKRINKKLVGTPEKPGLLFLINDEIMRTTKEETEDA